MPMGVVPCRIVVDIVKQASQTPVILVFTEMRASALMQTSAAIMCLTRFLFLTFRSTRAKASFLVNRGPSRIAM